MPKVVPDQKEKFENDELFRKLSREAEVKYTGHRDRPHEERKIKFQSECREGCIFIAYPSTGINLPLSLTTNSWSERPEDRIPTKEFVDFEKEPGKVHLKSQFIFNGVCVCWKGWIDLQRLDGVGAMEYDDERARVEDTALREQIQQYNQRLQHIEERQRQYREERERQAEIEAERRRRYVEQPHSAPTHTFTSEPAITTNLSDTKDPIAAKRRRQYAEGRPPPHPPPSHTAVTDTPVTTTIPGDSLLSDIRLSDTRYTSALHSSLCAAAAESTFRDTRIAQPIAARLSESQLTDTSRLIADQQRLCEITRLGDHHRLTDTSRLIDHRLSDISRLGDHRLTDPSRLGDHRLTDTSRLGDHRLTDTSRLGDHRLTDTSRLVDHRLSGTSRLGDHQRLTDTSRLGDHRLSDTSRLIDHRLADIRFGDTRFSDSRISDTQLGHSRLGESAATSSYGGLLDIKPELYSTPAVPPFDLKSQSYSSAASLLDLKSGTFGSMAGSFDIKSEHFGSSSIGDPSSSFLPLTTMGNLPSINPITSIGSMGTLTTMGSTLGSMGSLGSFGSMGALGTFNPIGQHHHHHSMNPIGTFNPMGVGSMSTMTSGGNGDQRTSWE